MMWEGAGTYIDVPSNDSRPKAIVSKVGRQVAKLFLFHTSS